MTTCYYKTSLDYAFFFFFCCNYGRLLKNRFQYYNRAVGIILIKTNYTGDTDEKIAYLNFVSVTFQNVCTSLRIK